MGFAVIITDARFASSNLGKVTLTEDIPVRGIDVVAPDSFVGLSINLSCVFTPINTNQRGVKWSIVSGSEYASVSSTGVLTINESANESLITIQATSSSNPSISVKKTIVVTYYHANIHTYSLSDTANQNNALSSNKSYNTGYSANQLNIKDVERLSSTKLLDPSSIIEVYTNGVNPDDAGVGTTQAVPSILYFSSDMISISTLVGVQYVDKDAQIAYNAAKYRMDKIVPIVPDGARYAIVCCNTNGVIAKPEGGYYIKTTEVL